METVGAMDFKFVNHIKNNIFATTIFSEERRFIYLKPGRTAGTGMYRHHMKNTDAHEVQLNEDSLFWRLTDEEIKDKYFVFVFVRNPFERLVSGWKSFLEKTPPYVHTDFKMFIKNNDGKSWLTKDGLTQNDHWSPLCHYVEYKDKNKFVDFIGRFENLNYDWEYVAKKINLNTTLPKVNSSSHSYYRNYYDDEIKELVSEFYKRDFDLLGYEF